METRTLVLASREHTHTLLEESIDPVPSQKSFRLQYVFVMGLVWPNGAI